MELTYCYLFQSILLKQNVFFFYLFKALFVLDNAKVEHFLK